MLAPGLWAPRLPAKVSRDPVPAASSNDLWDAHLYCLCLSASLFHLPSVLLPGVTSSINNLLDLPFWALRREKCTKVPPFRWGFMGVCLHWWATPQPQEHPKSSYSISDSLISLSDLNVHLTNDKTKSSAEYQVFFQLPSSLGSGTLKP